MAEIIINFPYRAAKAEYDKIMKVLNGWGIKTMWNEGAEDECKKV